MKTLTLLLLFFSFSFTILAKKKEDRYRKVTNYSFREGEVLNYIIHYGFLDAGAARLELVPEKEEMYGRKILHCVGTGWSLKKFDWIFKVRDRYETYMDAEGVFPYKFVRRVDEGGYKINQNYHFYPSKNKIHTGKKDLVESPEKYVQDMISSFYYARTIDFKNANKGDIFTIPSFVDGKFFPIKIKYKGEATISIRSGKYKCFLFNPVVQTGRIFKNENDLKFYVTNDKNKIPILVEAKLLIGAIKMELTSYEGLAGPLAKLK